MIKRVITLFLVVILTALLIPAPASAATTEAAEIQKQIRNTYLTALRRSGRRSFNGFCGSLVNWQTCLLGIDERVYGCDGKDEYDLYVNMGTTTGGYRVKSYPASRYDLRSALNAITCNGKTDAYNILVGFQRTNTQEGRIYGHALLIHAVLDGMVYFTECFNASIGGKYWAEGTAICVSMDTFCDYYNRWTVFDGIAYFGIKTYADVCREYPADMYAMATQELPVYGEPSDPGIHEAEQTGEFLLPGEMVRVTGLLETPGGAYWYQLDRNGAAAYVQAEHLAFESNCYEDIQITDLKVPTALRRHSGFVLRGNVTAQYGQIREVQVAVYDPAQQTREPVLCGTVETDGKSVSLSSGQLDRTLTFRNLKAGTYRIVIEAQIETYSFINGQPVSNTESLELWCSEMRIINDWGKYAAVTFEENGGQAALQQTVVPAGAAVSELPTAYRPNYILKGWSLDPQGKQMVTDTTVIEENVTLYAQWKAGLMLHSGWMKTEESWRYYAGGRLVRGWFSSNGLSFYQNSDGTMAAGWQQIDGKSYYFNRAGVKLTGWQQIGGQRYYLYEDGGRATGWVTLDGKCYYFAQDGHMETQWVEENGNYYYLLPCGNKATGKAAIDGVFYSFGSDGALQYVWEGKKSGCLVYYDRQSAGKTIGTSQRLLIG